MERKNTHSTNRDGLLLRSESRSAATTSSDFVLQWGNRKRLRCMKVQVNNTDPNGSGPVQRATARVERRVVRSDLNNNSSKDPNSNQHNNINAVKSNGVGNGYLNFRHRPASPSHRILRNSESSIGMRGHSNGVRGLASPDRGDRKGTATGNNNNTHHHNNKINNSNHHYNENHHGSGGAGGSGSSETAHDGGKKGGSQSGGDTIAAVWPPKFVLALTNKEKEEDFMAFKGSKLPQRPKKRAKFIQRTLNQLVSPGAWLCDLTLERYEVREKKVTKKRPRGLKAMGNMDSDSE
ncbi:probable serine/threonine-protein kinase DDB_G0282963 isoform X1 [Sesamum indicum]|uniref:Probable serine/threonine-protein kinase DDB_G0282963 isoform X1 n=1 Tax=Sesamum indicum TaxID=4182 RepID=A0A6I9UDD4_SESIN|nr:probable serine/threonine-protein kinase DDB_G0282963 isoform X1 [Sesamum indicum]